MNRLQRTYCQRAATYIVVARLLYAARLLCLLSQQTRTDSHIDSGLHVHVAGQESLHSFVKLPGGVSMQMAGRDACSSLPSSSPLLLPAFLALLENA